MSSIPRSDSEHTALHGQFKGSFSPFLTQLPFPKQLSSRPVSLLHFHQYLSFHWPAHHCFPISSPGAASTSAEVTSQCLLELGVTHMGSAPHFQAFTFRFP